MADNFTYSIGLNISANTQDAQRQITQLRSQLNTLLANNLGKIDLSKSLNTSKAISDVSLLSGVLKTAVSEAGTLDLAKFTQGLQKSNRDITSFATSFRTMGIEGQKAFLQLNASIASAEQPLIRVKGLLDKFIDQMIRTTSIQISYGILNAFTGTFSNALRYAEKLDETLTDIQIVTKQSTKEMERFAKTANNAAKSLAVSTTDYTKAALIFYQQGLSDDAVQERTEVTLKLANASGEAAEDISSYMTAIWNNFDDGSKSLEYYADVIAKLGADTAASNADIAEGMQAFAAVADTVGLSYEYATSALALLVDKTQQSSDVVGNSLKTIFARLESVSLGETLDDDTDLTKYSAALEKVGVNIKDGNGGLKDMDTILDELGSKWENLNEQQKMGLAYTVAGVRQYNNFISLLDNYDDYQRLIESAKRSTGELNKEQEIYAESWEAARDRVEAAAQGIYQSLLDDKFFKELTNLLATVLNGVQAITDGFGGMKGALLLIGSLATSIFKDKLIKGINVISQELYGLTTAGQTKMRETQAQSRMILENPEKFGMKGFSGADAAAVEGLSKRTLIQNQLNDKASKLTEIQKAQIAQEQEALNLKISAYEEAAKALELTEKQMAIIDSESKRKTYNIIEDSGVKNISDNDITDNQKSGIYKNINGLADVGAIGSYITENDFSDITAYNDLVQNVINNTELFKKSQVQSAETIQDLIPDLQELFAWVKEFNNESAEYTKQELEYRAKAETAYGEEKEQYIAMANKAKEEAEAFSSLAEEKVQNSKELTKALKEVDKLTNSVQDKNQMHRVLKNNNIKTNGENVEKLKSELRDQTQAKVTAKVKLYIDQRDKEDLRQDVENTTKEIQDHIDKLSPDQIKVIQDAFTDTASCVMQLGMVMTSLGSVWDTISNPDLSGWEKFKAIMSSMITIIPTIITLTKMLSDTEKKENAQKALGIILDGKSVVAKTAKVVIEKIENSTIWETVTATWAEVAAALGLDAALSPLLIIVLAIVAALGSLTLLAIGIVTIVKKLISLNPEEKLKAAAEETERAAQAADDAADAYDNLITTLEGLDGIYDELNDLTAGTIEWKKAILDANNQAKELIDTYGLIQGQDWNLDDNGVIRFTEAGEEKMKQAEYEKVQNANNAYEGAKYNENKLENNQSLNKIAQEESLAEVSASSEESAYQTAYLASKSAMMKAIQNGTLDLNSNTWKEQLTKLGLDDDTYTLLIDLLENNEELKNALQENSEAISLNNTEIQSGMMTDVAAGLSGDEQWDDLESGQKQDILAVGVENQQQAIETEIAKIKADSELKQQAKENYALAEGAYKEGNKWYIGEGDDKEEYELSDIADAAIAAMARANIVDQLIETYSNMSSSELEKIAAEAQSKRIYNSEQINAKYTDDKDYGTANLDEEELADYTLYLMENNTALAENKELAEDIAAANMNFNNGLEDLIDNADEYIDALDLSKRNTQEYVKALNSVRDDYAQILDIDPSELSEKFLTSAENLDLMKKAAEGDWEALSDLRELAAQDIIQQYKIEENLSDEEFQEKYGELQTLIANSETELGELKVGASIDSTGYDEILNEMIKSGNMTVEEVQAILNSLGFEPEIEYKEVSLSQAEAVQQHAMVYDPKTDSYHEITSDYQLGAEEKIYMPQINSSKTVYRGSPQATVSASNKSKAAGNKSKLKKADDEKDRYYVITKQMTALEKALDNITKAKERAFGADKLSLMDQEIAKYEDLAKAQQQYIDEIQSYTDHDIAIMKDYGAQIGEDGTILNYDELIANQVAAYNANPDDDATQEAYETFKKNLENYEDSISKMQEANAQLTDYLNAIYDAKLEKTVYKVELKIDVADDDLQYINFLKELLDEDSYDVTEAMGYITQEADATLSKITAVNEGIVDLFNNHGADGSAILQGLQEGTININELANAYSLTSSEVEQLRDWVQTLEDETVNFAQKQDELNQKLIDSFNNFSAKVDEQVKKVEHLNSVITSYKNIIDLVGKKTAGISDELYNSLQEKSMNVTITNLSMRQKEYEAAKKAYEDAVAKGVDDETLSQLEDNLNEIEETFMSSWESAIEKVVELFEDGLQQAVDKFSESVAGAAGSLDDLSDLYSRTKTQSENYLANYEKIYNLSKLTRNITNSIDNTDDIAGKKQLKSLMEEISALNDSDAKVSQYQLDTLQKRYDLYQAEIALREAQNAKSQVRMVQDNEGNMNYMYTADETAVGNAEQNYEDALYAYAQTNAQEIENISSQLIDIRTKLSEAYEELENGDQERAQELIDYYTEQERYLEEQMQLALDSNVEVNSYVIASNWDVADEFSETVYAQVTGFSTLEEVQANWQEATSQLAEDVAGVYEDFEGRYSAAMSAAGTSTEDFADTVDTELSDVEIKAGEAASEVDTMADDFDDAFDKASTSAVEFAKNYANVTDNVIKNTQTMIKGINDLIETLSSVGGANISTGKIDTSLSAAYLDGVEAIKQLGGDNDGDGDGDGEYQYQVSLGNGHVIGTYDSIFDAETVQEKYQGYADKMGETTYAYKNYKDTYIEKIKKYDTGGYTGEWGPEGRWALLHQKELVLNAEDTENILNAVDQTRKLAEYMAAQGYSSNADLSGNISSLANTMSGIEQNIVINAEFPDAVYHDEISAAFDDLLNRASQYANRK